MLFFWVFDVNVSQITQSVFNQYCKEMFVSLSAFIVMAVVSAHIMMFGLHLIKVKLSDDPRNLAGALKRRLHSLSHPATGGLKELQR